MAATDDSADGFRRYKELQQGGRTVGMVAFPNTLLIRAERDYLVDPGLIMQGGPVFGALADLGVEPARDQGRDPHPPALRPRRGPRRLAAAPRLRPPAGDRGAVRADRLRRAGDGRPRDPRRRRGRDRAGRALAPNAGPLRRPDLAAGRHRRRPDRDRLRLRRARSPSTSTRWTCPRTSARSARSCWSSGGGSASWTPPSSSPATTRRSGFGRRRIARTLPPSDRMRGRDYGYTRGGRVRPARLDEGENGDVSGIDCRPGAIRRRAARAERREGPTDRRRDAPLRRRARDRRAPRSSTSRARRESAAGCSTTTSGPRSGS